MTRRFDVTALGELLIDFTDSGLSPAGMRLFERNPGGAPANVLAALARFGHKTAFLGKVGADMHGEFLRDTLITAGIDVQGLISDPEVFTTLAFVALDPGGERSFSFARKPGADTCLRQEELDRQRLTDTRVLHIGSLSMTQEPVRSATLAAVNIARQAGAIISYDPNYRASLWPSRQAAEEQMRRLALQADIIKLSDEETELLTGERDPRQAALALRRQGAACVAVTLGPEGALVAAGDGVVQVPGFAVEPVDTTGAGDAFWGGFLHRLLTLNVHSAELTAKQAADCARWGNAVAACCIQKRGAIPAMPTLWKVEQLLEGEA